MTCRDIDLNISKETKSMLREVEKFSMEVMRPAGIELDRLADVVRCAGQEPVLDLDGVQRRLSRHAVIAVIERAAPWIPRDHRFRPDPKPYQSPLLLHDPDIFGVENRAAPRRHDMRIAGRKLPDDPFFLFPEPLPSMPGNDLRNVEPDFFHNFRVEIEKRA